ncbi:4Fe-4S dicluster domain-containing protein [candidate division KSB1 bacterium]|nr:4Fe-4S dicluster domain-containing protein [candidate division KSB1 bacterium]
MPTRVLYWNIPAHNLIYAFFAVALAIFVYGFYRRYRLWRLGQPEKRNDQKMKRFLGVLKDGLAQISVLREASPGLMHMAIFSGFVILTIGTILVFIQADFKIEFLYGNFYLWFSLILDVFGILFILGLLYAIFRRYVIRPHRLGRLTDDAVLLILLLVIGITGFLVEGARLAATTPQWAEWSPFGLLTAGLFKGMANQSIKNFHLGLWAFHMLISMAFIAYIPFSKLFHIFMSPANIYLKNLGIKGQLSTIDMEEAETFGVTDINQFTWKQLVDLDACTHCGRCQDRCPAFNSDKPLSPKKLILDLQGHMTDRGKQILAQKKKGDEIEPEPIIGQAVSEAEIWACTTCLACQEHCPVAIEHVQKIVDLRRAKVMMDSEFPQELAATFKGLENNSNPWNMGSSGRADWAEGLEVPLMAEKGEVDVLWFVGCAGSFDDRAKKISTALVKILKQAGVDFAILGTDEGCCGDPARRAGNEYLFAMMAEQNVETLKNFKFKKILTSCPHCYHMIKNEYVQFGGHYEVIHHSELIAGLIDEKKIQLTPQTNGRITLHDSCYLGRYNDIYEAPRRVLKSATKSKLVEMESNRNASFCCGAGGARMFMEETIGRRINQVRVEQGVNTGADKLCVACPFCLTMLDDGVKEKAVEDKVKVYDIAQIVADNLA